MIQFTDYDQSKVLIQNKFRVKLVLNIIPFFVVVGGFVSGVISFCDQVNQNKKESGLDP